MADDYSPLIYLFRDAARNVIRAASILNETACEDGFHTAILYEGRRYERAPYDILFWDHLSRDGQTESPTRGIQLFPMRPDDDVLLDAPFVKARPANTTLIDDFIFEIDLAGFGESLEPDGAQAFGSQYYLNGRDIIVALGGWSGVRYSFPIEGSVLTAVK